MELNNGQRIFCFIFAILLFTFGFYVIYEEEWGLSAIFAFAFGGLGGFAALSGRPFKNLKVRLMKINGVQMLKIKKIVAREGLIIVGLFLSAYCLNILYYNLTQKEFSIPYSELQKNDVVSKDVSIDADFEDNSIVVEPSDEEAAKIQMEFEARYELLRRKGLGISIYNIKNPELIIEKLKFFSNKDLASRAEMSLSALNILKAKLERNKKITNFVRFIGLFLSLWAYPLYLLYHFIAWAIRELKSSSFHTSR